MIRFYNGKVMRFGGGLRLTDEEVWTDGKRIVYVGAPKSEMPEFERQIDLRGDVLMPGFKNAHTHTAMTFLRTIAEKKELKNWLYEDIFPRETKLTDEGVYWSTKLGIMEYLSSGITASFEMYFHNDYYALANVESGFRTVITSALNDFDADPEDIEREFVKFNQYDELIGYRIGLHAEYTTGDDRIRFMCDLAEKYKAPCYIHLCETKSEVDECIERRGTTPFRYLDSMGFFRYGGGGFHCVWMDDEEIETFARRGLWAVTCPASNLKLASGIAPIEKMMKAGVNLAIGTDGASSNNALDMFREMYLVSVLQKYACESAAAGDAEKVLEMACVNGARAMGLNDCDDIAEGKLADMIVIDMDQPNMHPVYDIPANLVYSGAKNNVRLTMINGKILYENNEYHIGVDEATVYREVNRFAASVR